MRILVTFAVEAEFAPWRAHRQFVRQNAEGLKLWKRVIGKSEIFVLLTGIGDNSANVMELIMRVAASDLGKVIGKQGRTARSIHTILGAAGMKLNRRFTLEILE